MKKRDIAPAANVRSAAESRLAERRRKKEGGGVPAFASDAAALVHELQVHQIELEMQNEELRGSRAEVEIARARYEDLYDTAPCGYFTLDRASVIQEVNLTGARMLGVERSRLVSRRLSELICDADRPALASALSAARVTESLEVMLASSPEAGHGPSCLQLTVSAGAGADELRVVAIDVTARRMAEDGLRAVQKLDALGQLAGGVAHDFNTLLTVMLYHTSVAIESTPDHAPLHANLVELRASTERAASLVRQLLLFSRNQPLQWQLVDLNALIQSSRALLHTLLGPAIELLVSASPEPAIVRADPIQIEQVLMNLVVNARDAMPRGGALTLSTTPMELPPTLRDGVSEPARQGVRLTVSDTGTGMSDLTRGRIFEPFFTTKDVGQGTGLGLSTAFGIVKRGGGTISVQSELGKGTTFTVDLPRAFEPVLPATARTPAVATTGDGERRVETILVVDDDVALRLLVKRMLERAGYRVLLAASPEEALRTALEHEGTIHMTLTDVLMPGGMSGVGLAQRLRAILPGMKVVLMSGYTAEALPDEGLCPSDPFLGKPFELGELLRIVRSTIDS